MSNDHKSPEDKGLDANEAYSTLFQLAASNPEMVESINEVSNYIRSLESRLKKATASANRKRPADPSGKVEDLVRQEHILSIKLDQPNHNYDLTSSSIREIRPGFDNSHLQVSRDKFSILLEAIEACLSKGDEFDTPDLRNWLRTNKQNDPEHSTLPLSTILTQSCSNRKI